MNNIALAFSGGGFRAASFSLGSLSYLHRLQYGDKGKTLLEHVTFISSTSGGSITNLAYSAALFKGTPFKTLYDKLRDQLKDTKLLDDATNALNHPDSWKTRPDKTRNLINAFSLIYDEWLERETLSLFSDRSKEPHLEEICINATEFTNGLPFRFQSQNTSDPTHNGFVGNFFIHFDPKQPAVSGEIKLSDILAASSCFPSGFEPIIFPEDFAHEKLTVPALRKDLVYTANTFTLQVMYGEDKHPIVPVHASAAPTSAAAPVQTADQPLTRDLKYGNVDPFKDEKFTKEFHVGMMDGGVDDNQAINAFEQAYERRKKTHRPQFDLLMVCDVTSNFLDGYTLPLQKKKGIYALPAWPLLGAAVILWLLMAYFLTAGTIDSLDDFPHWPLRTWVLAIGAAVLDYPILKIIYSVIKNRIHKKQPSSVTMMLNKYGPRFLRLPLGALIQMILSRAKSVYLLANDIYLKQIRRMYYTDLFQLDQRFKDMVIQNTIYDCSKIKFNVPTPPPGPQPSKEMIDWAETARLMGTTLWFDDTNQKDETMKKIIVTGQFTTCYNLIRYLDSQPKPLDPALQTLHTALLADWAQFQQKTDFMY